MPRELLCLLVYHCGAIDVGLPLLKLWLVVVVLLILPLPAAGEVVLVAGEPGVYLRPVDLQDVVLDLGAVGWPPFLPLEVAAAGLVQSVEVAVLLDVGLLKLRRRLRVHHRHRRRCGLLHGGVLAAAAICRLLVEGLLLGE